MTEPRKYRKRPVVIEAMQFTGANAEAVVAWSDGKVTILNAPYTPERHLLVSTLEGAMRTDIWDFVIRGVQGEFYPCKPDIFAATYEETP